MPKYLSYTDTNYFFAVSIARLVLFFAGMRVARFISAEINHNLI
jgi:hypothetical protein